MLVGMGSGLLVGGMIARLSCGGGMIWRLSEKSTGNGLEFVGWSKSGGIWLCARIFESYRDIQVAISRHSACLSNLHPESVGVSLLPVNCSRELI